MRDCGHAPFGLLASLAVPIGRLPIGRTPYIGFEFTPSVIESNGGGKGIDARLLSCTLRVARFTRDPHSLLRMGRTPVLVGSDSLPTWNFKKISNGGSRIRTHGPRKGTTVFKTAAIDHSAIPPARGIVAEGFESVNLRFSGTRREQDGCPTAVGHPFGAARKARGPNRQIADLSNPRSP